MEKETFYKAEKIINEIKELKKIEKIFSDRECKSYIHFEILPHFGDCKREDKVTINNRHNDKLLTIVKEIISDLETELKVIQ